MEVRSLRSTKEGRRDWTLINKFIESRESVLRVLNYYCFRFQVVIECVLS